MTLAKVAGAPIWWVPISSSLYRQTPLNDIQAAWNPEVPLDTLSKPEQNAAIQKICTQLVEDCGFQPNVSASRRKRLSSELQTRLGDRYEVEKEVAAGRFSILFRAKQKNPARTVAVKLFVASEFDEWATDVFKQSVEDTAGLSSSAFIRIFDHQPEHPQFLVSEFVEGETLTKYVLRYPNGAPLSNVRRILRDLTQALMELHDRGRVRGELYPSNVLISPSGAARIATMDFSSILSSESIMAGDLRIDPESLTYMTPERFFGQAHDHLSDQFSLGLLAMELLGGERVPGVTRPRDLEDKQRLFKDFETGHGRWAQRSDAFSGLVSRLLRTNPEDRWDSMHDVSGILQDIEIAESPEERCRRIARSSYVKLQSGGRERAFFERFYNGLFASLPEIQRHFADADMSKQHAMLNKAVQLLIDFDPARGCEELAGLAASHAQFALTKTHYDSFLEVLLETIEQSGVKDPAELEAWRSAIAPALVFMRTCQSVPGTSPLNT